MHHLVATACLFAVCYLYASLIANDSQYHVICCDSLYMCAISARLLPNVNRTYPRGRPAVYVGHIGGKALPIST